MTSHLFLSDKIVESENANPYLEFFRDSVGKGKGHYYANIGEVYKLSPRYQKGFGNGVLFPYKQGTGLGSVLSNLWRLAAPMIKKSAQSLGKTAVNVASNIAQDVIEGKDIKESAQKHITGVINKTATPEEKPISQESELVAPTPTTFRRRPPLKRKKRVISRKIKYPALNYL